MIKSEPRGPLGGFERRLLAELTAVVRQRAAATDVTASAAVRPRDRRARRLVPVAAAAAALGTGLTVGLTTLLSDASPAYAVEKGADGDVIVSIFDTNRLGGLSGKLASVGVDAVVVPATADCAEPPLPPLPARAAVWGTSAGSGQPWEFHAQLPAGSVPAGRHVVLGFSADPKARTFASGLADHPVTCLPLPR
jgi:hypothetical protein